MVVFTIGTIFFIIYAVMDMNRATQAIHDQRLVTCLEEYKVIEHRFVNGELYCKVGDLWEKSL